MKKYLVITLLASFLISCKGFLDENPKSFLSPDNFYQSVDDLNSGLNAVYRAHQDKFATLWAGTNWFDWGTDIEEITDKSTWAHHNQIARLNSTFNSSSTIPMDFWQYIFNHLKDINALIDALNKIDLPEADKILIEGQARAMRAYLNFDGVRVFNGIPLMMQSSNDIDFLKTQKRSSPQEMYSVIIEDLEFAKDNLPNSWTGTENIGRLTSGAAAAMLAKVYMNMAGYPLNDQSKWKDAERILQEFIVEKKYGSQYDLERNFADLFDDKKAPGVEGIWTVNFTRGTYGQGNDQHTNFAPLELYYAPNLGLTYGGGWSNGIPTDKFYNSFDKLNDLRFKYTFWSSTAEIPEEYNAILPKDMNGNPIHINFYRPHVKKFREPTPNNNSQRTSLDVYIIRYADLLLMYAETLNELNNPNKDIYLNMVRKRAGLSPIINLGKEEFRNHMMLERAWELCFNDERKFDLVRWGVYVQRTEAWNPQVKGNIKSDKHEFWPIPQSQIDINPNLEQNKGW